MANYKIISAVKRTGLDAADRPIEVYHIVFTLLNTMATSFIEIPVVMYSKELRDKMIADEVKRLEEITA